VFQHLSKGSAKMNDQSDETKKDVALSAAEDDGFEGYCDTYVAPQEQTNASIVEGTQLKYANEGKWITREGADFDTNKELLVVRLLRVCQKWSPDNDPIEHKILAPNEPWPDVEAWNNACPRNEWRTGFNDDLVGPWQLQRVAYLLDRSAALKRFTYVTGTIGGQRTLSELARNVTWMRKYRGPGVLPVVRLESVFMPTRYGGRQAPCITIVRWIGPTGGGGEVESITPPPTLPPPQTAPDGVAEILPPLSPAAKEKPALKPAASKPAPKPKQKPAAKISAGLQTVEGPSLKEEMQDEIPW
jgi:hypothetical protein